jgi:hypothetical protein
MGVKRGGLNPPLFFDERQVEPGEHHELTLESDLHGGIFFT